MNVYVDELRPARLSKNWPYGRVCRMFAGTAKELHEMAGMIGLSRSWFRSSRDFPHYDLSAYQRRQAIARGAVEVDQHFTARFIQGRRDARKARNKT